MLVLEGESLGIFRAAIKSKYTRDHYERHLGYFFSYSKTNADSFIEKAKKDPAWTEREVISYIRSIMARVEKKELEPSSVQNYTKPIRVFLDMNDLVLNWKKINRLLPSSKKKSNDRPPTVEEIKRICAYPDRRVKGIILSMISGGWRIGAWDYLTWGDIEPIEKDGQLIAAKVVIYRGEPEEYFTFITPEAYSELKIYMDYRSDQGEKISKKSPVMRDLISGDRTGKGLVTIPKRLKSSGVTRVILDALWGSGVRKELEKGEKRHPFKADHGFRKFHETVCIDQAKMDIIKLKMLRGDSIELEGHYYRPSQEILLQEFEKAIPHLTLFSKVTVVLSENVETFRARA